MAPEDAPATKRDIGELSARVDGVEAGLAAMEERLLERMRDMQTELLKAFLPFQEDTRLRHTTLEVRQASLEARSGEASGRDRKTPADEPTGGLTGRRPAAGKCAPGNLLQR